jgi:hypothetical protein
VVEVDAVRAAIDADRHSHATHRDYRDQLRFTMPTAARPATIAELRSAGWRSQTVKTSWANSSPGWRRDVRGRRLRHSVVPAIEERDAPSPGSGASLGERGERRRAWPALVDLLDE